MEINPVRVISFAPLKGQMGATITIYGNGLAGTTSVEFNGVSATITNNTATQIIATVPAGATSGPITVTTASGTGVSVKSFTVKP